MKCTWYADFEGVCTNDECPYSGDTCPTSEHPEVCKYAEYTEKQPEIPQLSVEELAKTLRLCDSTSCVGCALFEFVDCGSAAKQQAADMLEKLAAEKDAKKPEWISVKDRLPEKNSIVLVCMDNGQYKVVLTSHLSSNGEWILYDKNRKVTHWMPFPEPPKEEER